MDPQGLSLTLLLAAGAGFLSFVSVVGQTLLRNQTVILRVGGLLVVVLGLHTLGLVRIPVLYQQKRLNLGGTDGTCQPPPVADLGLADQRLRDRTRNVADEPGEDEVQARVSIADRSAFVSSAVTSSAVTSWHALCFRNRQLTRSTKVKEDLSWCSSSCGCSVCRSVSSFCSGCSASSPDRRPVRLSAISHLLTITP